MSLSFGGQWMQCQEMWILLCRWWDSVNETEESHSDDHMPTSLLTEHWEYPKCSLVWIFGEFWGGQSSNEQGHEARSYYKEKQGLEDWSGRGMVGHPPGQKEFQRDGKAALQPAQEVPQRKHNSSHCEDEYILFSVVTVERLQQPKASEKKAG